MNPNNFKKYYLLQTACLLSFFAVVVFYLYQPPSPTLADRESALSSGLHEAGIVDVNHKYKNERVDDDRSLDLHTLEENFETGTVRINIVEDRLEHSVFALRRQLRTIVVEGSVESSDLASAAAFVNTVLEVGSAAAPRKTNVIFTGAAIY